MGIKFDRVVNSITIVPDMVDTTTENAVAFASLFRELLLPHLDRWPNELNLKLTIAGSGLCGGPSAEYKMVVDSVRGCKDAAPCLPLPLSPVPAPAPPKAPSAPCPALTFVNASDFMHWLGPKMDRISNEEINAIVRHQCGRSDLVDLIGNGSLSQIQTAGRAINTFLNESSPVEPQPKPEIDRDGNEWNPAIHAGTKRKNQDGTWRRKRVETGTSTKEDILHKRGFITVEECCELLGFNHQIQITNLRSKNDMFPQSQQVNGFSAYRRKDVVSFIQLFGKPGVSN